MILEVEGIRYSLDKRKAKVGERVLFNHKTLRIAVVKDVYGMTVVDTEGKENFHTDYIVLKEIKE